MTVRGHMTAEELLHLPQDGYRTELVKGELIRMSPTGRKHGRSTAKLAHLLYSFVEARDLGEVCGAETGFILARNPDTVRAADAAFVAKARLPDEATAEKFWPIAPDLAFEVLSPEDRPGEVERKVQEYLAAGTKLVVVADPKKETATVRRPGAAPVHLGPEDTLDLGDILPGFSVRVADIFG